MLPSSRAPYKNLAASAHRWGGELRTTRFLWYEAHFVVLLRLLVDLERSNVKNQDREMVKMTKSCLAVTLPQMVRLDSTADQNVPQIAQFRG